MQQNNKYPKKTPPEGPAEGAPGGKLKEGDEGDSSPSLFPNRKQKVVKAVESYYSRKKEPQTRERVPKVPASKKQSPAVPIAPKGQNRSVWIQTALIFS